MIPHRERVHLVVVVVVVVVDNDDNDDNDDDSYGEGAFHKQGARVCVSVCDVRVYCYYSHC